VPPDLFYTLFLITVIGGFTAIVTWPLMRAFADRIRGHGAAAGTEQLQAQQDALARDLEQTRHDVAELQERLDFAERLLAKQQDPARIAPPPR
jgi:outer membrane murein-binding lipoprotein Lpp